MNIKNTTHTNRYLDDLSKTWADFYLYDIDNAGLTPAQQKLVLGGEACMWGEWVDDVNHMQVSVTFFLSLSLCLPLPLSASLSLFCICSRAHITTENLATCFRDW